MSALTHRNNFVRFHRRVGQARRGFTLLETLLASSVFLAGFAGVTAMQLQSARQLAAAGHKERATQIANSLVDLGRLLPLADLGALSSGATLYYDVDGNPLTGARNAFYTVTVGVSTQAIPNDTVYNLRAQLQWTEPYARLPVSLAVEASLPSS